MTQLKVNNENADCWQIEGEVDYDSVVALTEQGNSLLKKHRMKQCTIDFSGLTRFNSALLSALLCWVRSASSLGIKISFQSAPDMAYQMAELYGLKFLLETK